MPFVSSGIGFEKRFKPLVVALVISSAVLLTGCALLPVGGDDSDSSDGWSTIRLSNPNGTTTEWSVSERAGTNRLLVSLPAGRAIGLGLAGTMVLSPSAFVPDQTEYQKAAMQFLERTDRPSCRIIGVTKTSQFQYEFQFDCMKAAFAPLDQPGVTR